MPEIWAVNVRGLPSYKSYKASYQQDHLSLKMRGEMLIWILALRDRSYDRWIEGQKSQTHGKKRRSHEMVFNLVLLLFSHAIEVTKVIWWKSVSEIRTSSEFMISPAWIVFDVTKVKIIPTRSSWAKESMILINLRAHDHDGTLPISIRDLNDSPLYEMVCNQGMGYLSSMVGLNKTWNRV